MVATFLRNGAVIDLKCRRHNIVEIRMQTIDRLYADPKTSDDRDFPFSMVKEKHTSVLSNNDPKRCTMCGDRF